MQRLPVAALAAVVLMAGLATSAAAGAIEASIKDTGGKPVAEAVIIAVAPAGPRPASPRAGKIVVDQQNRQFVPHVQPVVVGTEVVFPNKDNIRHHVYSFSPPKKFELPLYKGTEAPPVKFDKPGLVVLGCNIHDWMLGYVVVLETPHFQTTDASGRARLESLPPGTYAVRVWHARLAEADTPAPQTITIAAGKDERIELALKLKPDVRLQPPPSAGGGKYR